MITSQRRQNKLAIDAYIHAHPSSAEFRGKNIYTQKTPTLRLRGKTIYINKKKDENHKLKLNTVHHCRPQMESATRQRLWKSTIPQFPKFIVGIHNQSTARSDSPLNASIHELPSDYSIPKQATRWSKKCFKYILAVLVFHHFSFTHCSRSIITSLLSKPSSPRTPMSLSTVSVPVEDHFVRIP